MDKDIEQAVSKRNAPYQGERNIGESTLLGLQIQAVRDQTRETKKLSSRNIQLQNKVVWLTVAIVALTIILVIIGMIQLKIGSNMSNSASFLWISSDFRD